MKKIIILFKKWVNVFHTWNYISVRKYEVWLHLRYIYANTDEKGMHKTKKIKTFQSKKHPFSQNHSIHYIIFLKYNIVLHK